MPEDDLQHRQTVTMDREMQDRLAYRVASL